MVTGAGRNIGRAIALALADAGASVVVNARSSREEIASVAKEIEGLAILADITDEKAVEAMVAQALAKFGRLDILVNNAAIRAVEPLEGIDAARWREVTGVILDGACPTRLLSGLPAQIPAIRCGLKQAIDETRSFLAGGVSCPATVGEHS